MARQGVMAVVEVEGPRTTHCALGAFLVPAHRAFVRGVGYGVIGAAVGAGPGVVGSGHGKGL